MTPEELLAHTDFIRSIARSLVGDEHTAADIAQEAYVAAMEHPSSEVRQTRAWLSKVTRNFVRILYRSETSRRERERIYSRPRNIAPPEQIVAREEVRRLITDAVLGLGEPYRSAILLRFYEDLPPREISKYLDVPIETVKKRLHRALAQLRLKLDAQHGGDRKKWLMAIAPIAGVKVGGTAGAAGLGSTIAGAVAMGMKYKISLVAAVIIGLTCLLSLQLMKDTVEPSDPRFNEGTFASDDGSAGETSQDTFSSTVIDPMQRERMMPREKPEEPPAALLSGIVVDAKGRAIPGATVLTGRASTWFEYSIEAASPDNPPQSPILVQSRTGDDGRFEITVPRLPDLGLVVSHPDFVLYERQNVYLSRRGLDLGRIELQPGCAVSGTINNHLGRPVANALVCFEPELASMDRLGLSFCRLLRIARVVGKLPSASTDSGGRFRLRGLWPIEGRVVVKAPDYPATWSDRLDLLSGSEITDLTIRLGKGLMIQGIVYDEHGRPVENADLICQPASAFPGTGGWALPDSAKLRSHDACTDVRGHFAFRNLARSRYSILAKAEGYSRSVRKDVDPGSEDPLEMILQPRGSIAGRVLQKDPRLAFEDIELRLERTDCRGFLDHDPFPEDSDIRKISRPGDFVLSDVEAGRYEVTARSRGFSPATVRVEVLPGARTSGIVIQMEPEAAVTGLILDDETNLPVPGALVRLMRGSSRPEPLSLSIQMQAFEWNCFVPDESFRTARSDARGLFEFRALPEDAYQLFISHPDYASTCIPECDLGTGELIEGMTVRLCTGGTLHGHVLARAGEPVMGEMVGVQNRNSREFCFTTFTDSNGFYQFEHLPAGPYSVLRRPGVHAKERQDVSSAAVNVMIVGLDEKQPDSRFVEIRNGAVSTLDFMLGQCASLTGVVHSAAGPLGGVTVRVTRFKAFESGRLAAVAESRIARTAQDGMYRLADLESGSYCVEVRHPDGIVPVIQKIRVRDGGPTRLDFFLEGGIIRGRVCRSNDGAPLGGAKVVLVRGEEEPLHIPVQTMMFSSMNSMEEELDVRHPLTGMGIACTGDDGRFSIPWIPEGRYKVRVSHPGFIPFESNILIIHYNTKVDMGRLSLDIDE